MQTLKAVYPFLAFMRYRAGPLHPNWVENPGYQTIHAWLKNTFGKPNKCEMPGCSKKSKSYNWSKKRGLEYERKRENFWMLCASCHRKYDYTKTVGKNMSMGMKGKRKPWFWKPVIQFDLNGNFIMEWPSVADAERALKISNISTRAKLRCGSAGGFRWRYKD